MKRRIQLLDTLYRKYGFANGLKAFWGFNFGEIHSIKVPEVKYPIQLRYQSTDIETFHQVFINDEYGINLPFEPKIIIDGGANIGLYALKMKNKFPEAKIICIEPDPENFPVLEKNTSEYENIFCEPCGLWSSDTTLKVYDKYSLGKWGMVVEEDSIGGQVKAISLDTLIKKYKIDCIDILKLDIETSEKQLFSKNFEEWLPKVKMIIIELHDFMEEGCAMPFFEAIHRTIKNYRYLIKGENTIIINQDMVSSASSRKPISNNYSVK